VGGVEGLDKIWWAVTMNLHHNKYNVRGGNYDENLIYINDFEIFLSLFDTERPAGRA
jgi:hypothetical protein